MSEASSVCAYCGHEGRAYFNGRRWICGDCWRENMGEEPPDWRHPIHAFKMIPRRRIVWQLRCISEVEAKGLRPVRSQNDGMELFGLRITPGHWVAIGWEQS